MRSSNSVARTDSQWKSRTIPDRAATSVVRDPNGSAIKKPVSVIDTDVDSHRSLRTYLENSQEFRLCQWYTKPEEGIKDIASHPPAVVVIDTCLACKDGIECVHTLKRVLPRLNVITF